MKLVSIMRLLCVAGLAVAAVPGGAQAQGADVVDVAGVCAACHFAESEASAEHGGHARILACTSCHPDRRPEHFGRGHRGVERCASCHPGVEGHPPRARKGRRMQRNCVRCHTPHGSPNLALVREQIRHRRRLIPIDFVNTSGVAEGGFVDPDDPSGLCEGCHRKTEFDRRDGTGAPHFTDSCTDCHLHEAGFEAVVDDRNCGICHEAQAERFAKPSGHSARFVCSDCHPDAGAPIGPGHRGITDCAACHDTATHAPMGSPGFPCETCHEPHGTDNEYLVREAIDVPQNGLVPIRFDNLEGLAVGSFASPTDPGSGICEVCHTTTQFYRADGTGDSHFTFSCLPCHRHSEGFSPR